MVMSLAFLLLATAQQAKPNGKARENKDCTANKAAQQHCSSEKRENSRTRFNSLQTVGK